MSSHKSSLSIPRTPTHSKEPPITTITAISPVISALTLHDGNNDTDMDDDIANANNKNTIKTKDANDDDFDIMLLHEDFPHLLAIATKAKSTRLKIAALEGSSGNEKRSLLLRKPHLPQTALRPDEVLAAVERMQQALLYLPAPAADESTEARIIPRGLYPITDSIMEDSMLLLQEEHEAGEQWLLQQQQYQQLKPPLTSSSMTAAAHKRGRDTDFMRGDEPYAHQSHSHARMNGAVGGSAVAPRKESIVVKYAKWQTDVLMNWMIEHKDAPFPNQGDIEWLTSQTGLSNIQIVNWTTNVRKRNRKATCVGGKKPHHFIDFLFLVQDREAKDLQQQQRQELHNGSEHFPTATNMNSSNVQYGPPSYRKYTQRSSGDVRRQQPQEAIKQSHALPLASVSSSTLLYGKVNRYAQPYRPLPTNTTTTSGGGNNTYSRPTKAFEPIPEMTASSSSAFYPDAAISSSSAFGRRHMPGPVSLPHGNNADDPIMIDFSDCWLTESDGNFTYTDELEEHPHRYSSEGTVRASAGRICREASDILPTVTYDDSSSNNTNQPPPTKPRSFEQSIRDGSFGFGSMDDEQFKTLGLEDGYVFQEE